MGIKYPGSKTELNFKNFGLGTGKPETNLSLSDVKNEPT